MGTQWRTGGFGATGLDYSALESVMRLFSVKKSAKAEVFYDVRAMESEALAVMAETQEK